MTHSLHQIIKHFIHPRGTNKTGWKQSIEEKLTKEKETCQAA
jgi:hypothetical protein